MGTKISDLAKQWGDKYPEQVQLSFSLTYAAGALRALEILEDTLDNQRNLISQIAWDRIQDKIKELKS